MSLNKVCSECPVLDRAQGEAQPHGLAGNGEDVVHAPHRGWTGVCTSAWLLQGAVGDTFLMTVLV